MPDVISSTTPFLYLHQLGCLDFLPQLYQTVLAPQAVMDELRQGELKGFDVPSLKALAWVQVQAAAPLDLLRVARRFARGYLALLGKVRDLMSPRGGRQRASHRSPARCTI